MHSCVVEVRRCICSLPWESESRSHLLVSRVRRRCRPGGATWPFFTCLPTHYLISPGADAPSPLPLPLPAGLSALTSRPNPQNSLPSASMPPLPSSLSAPFSPPSIHLGPAADRWPLRRGSQQGSGLLSGTFFRRWREMNWGEIGADLMKERSEGKTCWGGQRKYRSKY